MIKVGDKVKVIRGLNTGITGIAEKIVLSNGAWIYLRGHGYSLNNIELVEDKMEIKINYKPVMTEQEQRETLLKLLDDAYYAGAGIIKEWEGTEILSRKAITICKNELQEVESVDITVSYHCYVDGKTRITLTADEIREIQAIKL